MGYLDCFFPSDPTWDIPPDICVISILVRSETIGIGGSAQSLSQGQDGASATVVCTGIDC